MSETSPPVSSRAAFETFARRRPRAFDAAGRHTQRVRFMRRAIVVVCVASVGLLTFFSMFDPLHRLKLGLSIGSVGLSGTKVTMHDPKLSGMKRDGHPYEVKAGTATQDTKVANVIELTDVDLRLGQNDGSTTRITARTGLYDTDKDRLDLAGSVRFINDGHYDMALERSVMDMRGGVIETDRPAVVVIPGGRIEGDSLRFSDETQSAVISGHVHSSFTQDGDGPGKETRVGDGPARDASATEAQQ